MEGKKLEIPVCNKVEKQRVIGVGFFFFKMEKITVYLYVDGKDEIGKMDDVGLRGNVLRRSSAIPCIEGVFEILHLTWTFVSS